jgi:hypothetical protein
MILEENSHIKLRLSAQRALWGHVPPSLRSVSVEIENNIIKWRCVFDIDANEDDFELLNDAATEVTCDYGPEIDLNEELVVIEYPKPTRDLKWVVYYRHEHNYYKD